MPWGPDQCDKIRDIEEAIPREIEANDIVFSVHIPLPSMEMSPWFQFMLLILQLDIAFKLNNQISKCTRLSFLSYLGHLLASGSFRASSNNSKMMLLIQLLMACYLLGSFLRTCVNPPISRGSSFVQFYS